MLEFGIADSARPMSGRTSVRKAARYHSMVEQRAKAAGILHRAPVASTRKMSSTARIHKLAAVEENSDKTRVATRPE
jgi:hypothetical protein